MLACFLLIVIVRWSVYLPSWYHSISFFSWLSSIRLGSKFLPLWLMHSVLWVVSKRYRLVMSHWEYLPWCNLTLRRCMWSCLRCWHRLWNAFYKCCVTFGYFKTSTLHWNLFLFYRRRSTWVSTLNALKLRLVYTVLVDTCCHFWILNVQFFLLFLVC